MRICALFILLVMAILPSRGQNVSGDGASQEPYLVFSRDGVVEHATYAPSTRIRYWVHGQSGKNIGYIIEVTPDSLHLDRASVALEDIRRLSRYSEKDQKHLRGANAGIITMSSLIVGGTLINAFFYDDLVLILGNLGLLNGVIFNPPLIFSRFLILGNHYDIFGDFIQGPLQSSPNPSAVQQDPIPEPDSLGNEDPDEYFFPQDTTPFVFTPSQQKLPRLGVSGWVSGDGVTSVLAEYLVKPQLSVGAGVNPLWSPNLYVTSKVFFKPYQAPKYNWYVSGRVGGWSAPFRNVQVLGGYLGGGFERYKGKAMFWGLQLGAWYSPVNGLLVPEISAQVGFRLLAR